MFFSGGHSLQTLGPGPWRAEGGRKDGGGYEVRSNNENDLYDNDSSSI